jgi:hypothetical protein
VSPSSWDVPIFFGLRARTPEQLQFFFVSHVQVTTESDSEFSMQNRYQLIFCVQFLGLGTRKSCWIFGNLGNSSFDVIWSI